MREILKVFLVGIFICFYVYSNPALAADFDITVSSSGLSQTITIQNNSDFPAYVYDLVKTDGSKIGISTKVIDNVTIKVTGDLTGVVEARCLAAENSFEGWEKWLYNPTETDGLFHYTAKVVQ